MDRDIKFFDGLWYCYANSTAMLLNSFNYDVKPSLIEVLSGVGLGSFLQDGNLFFSGLTGAPDTGITKSLNILGFRFDESNNEDPNNDPFKNLENVLKHSPLVIGPLDMQYLVYNPKRPKYPGVDHYVLVYKVNDDKVYLNDPAGYARVFIDKENLLKSWRADSIGYKRGHYRCWTNPQRAKEPSSDEIYTEALQSFKDLYTSARQKADQQKRNIDEDAIKEFSALVIDNTLTDQQKSFLIGFALPLGAKRAYHFSQFFKEKHPELSQLKGQQSELFGEAHTLAVQENRERFSETLLQLAEIEVMIRNEILSA